MEGEWEKKKGEKRERIMTLITFIIMIILIIITIATTLTSAVSSSWGASGTGPSPARVSPSPVTRILSGSGISLVNKNKNHALYV